MLFRSYSKLLPIYLIVSLLQKDPICINATRINIKIKEEIEIYTIYLIEIENFYCNNVPIKVFVNCTFKNKFYKTICICYIQNSEYKWFNMQREREREREITLFYWDIDVYTLTFPYSTYNWIQFNHTMLL